MQRRWVTDDEGEVEMAMEWKNVDRTSDTETSCLTLTGDCYILLRRLNERWIGKLHPVQSYFDKLTANNADAAKAEIVERARVILTEALAALPEER